MQLSRLPDNFEIAPGYTVEAWKKLILDEAPHNTEDWNTAVKILETRIRSRFLTPAQFLIDSDSDKGRRTNGFAILAIDFLVIETIQGFRTGQISHRAQSKKLFQAFLAGWEAFTACVPEGMDANALAANVYEQGRCSLHHSGSTDRIIVRKSGSIFVFHADGRIEINRTLLHEALSKEFDAYQSELRIPENADLRKKFKNKMNHICGQ